MTHDLIEFKNREGEIVGCYITSCKPVFSGMTFNLQPTYTFELVSRPMLYAYPEVILDFCEN
jgi:hypothetical protein